LIDRYGFVVAPLPLSYTNHATGGCFGFSGVQSPDIAQVQMRRITLKLNQDATAKHVIWSWHSFSLPL